MFMSIIVTLAVSIVMTVIAIVIIGTSTPTPTVRTSTSTGLISSAVMWSLVSITIPPLPIPLVVTRFWCVIFDTRFLVVRATITDVAFIRVTFKWSERIAFQFFAGHQFHIASLNLMVTFFLLKGDQHQIQTGHPTRLLHNGTTTVRFDAHNTSDRYRALPQRRRLQPRLPQFLVLQLFQMTRIPHASDTLPSVRGSSGTNGSRQGPQTETMMTPLGGGIISIFFSLLTFPPHSTEQRAPKLPHGYRNVGVRCGIELIGPPVQIVG
mmetsp:Transcript_57091/g.68664  ORF Transcript_57091/g.68664 Transcript_57091/m.68664 type:complete len:266 (-) Transcript_57091:76-873(-)